MQLARRLRWLRHRLRMRNNRVAPWSNRLSHIMNMISVKYNLHLCNNCAHCDILFRLHSYLSDMFSDINVPHEVDLALNQILVAVRDWLYYGIDTSQALALSIMNRQRAHLDVYTDIFLGNGRQIVSVIGHCDSLCTWCQHYVQIQATANQLCSILNCAK